MPGTDYDLVVIGGGSAGLTASGLAAALGAKTALVERHLLGGECTWTGCIPSKSLVRSARVLHLMRSADRFGLPPVDSPAEFRDVMERMRAVREGVYAAADSPEVVRSRNIDVIEGTATFLDPHTLSISGASPRIVRSRYIAICTGSRPLVPPIPGLSRDMALTNETIFDLDRLPGRLLVLGAGPLGLEMAQTFRRFGSDVTVVDKASSVLTSDEPECSALVRERLESEGIRFILNSTIARIADGDDGRVAIVEGGGHRISIPFDRLLLAAGRVANTAGLGLDRVGVGCTDRGIIVDDSMRTSASHIYACGDVAEGERNFSHLSENTARVAVSRMLLKVPLRRERRVVSWVTFTDPESAHLGMTSRELSEKGISFETIRFPYGEIDRALTDGSAVGTIVIHATPLRGRILGAHIVGDHAGEMICELALAMKNGLPLRRISDTIHPYPTYLLGVRRAADQWYMRRTPHRLIRLLGLLFRYRGTPS
jgi:pyruvate/2-oxoglutarate dehydrogenase complex dihydrolipoamide dehydrogenase (E3) component